jgi:amino-acid N-acetyltransferase
MAAILFRQNKAEDLNPIISLLGKNNLPFSDLKESKTEFILALDDQNIIGCIGIEKHGTDGFLRSFAVDDTYKNKGIGAMLLEKIIAFSIRLEITNFHLLTTTAENYFLAKGFIKVDRNEAPDSIKNTTEFSSVCPLSSSYMVLKAKNVF